jgi:hypothetical protein
MSDPYDPRYGPQGPPQGQQPRQPPQRPQQQQQEPQRQLPTSTVQAAGQAASDIIGGLKTQPMLLALVVMNIIGIGAGIWVVSDLAKLSNARFGELSGIVKNLTEIANKCLEHLARQ